MKIETIFLMKDGPERTAALASWVQHLYPEGSDPPVLVGGAAVVLHKGSIEVITIRPESLLVDRLRSLVFWRYREDGLNAFLLVWFQKEAISLSKVRSLAKDTTVLGAFESLWHLAGSAEKRKPRQSAIDEWLEQYLR